MNNYLEPSTYINWKHHEVLAQANILAKGVTNSTELIKNCFEFVRDDIKHSWDHKLGPVTCKAEDVLKHKTGFCYAKSHLLAALLRANSIPTALCYQRLTITDKPPFCLHGLNAIYLEDIGWHRIDARGNSESVTTEFDLQKESLAFPIVRKGEANFPDVYEAPLPVVIEALEQTNDIYWVSDNLPDLE